MSNSPFLFEDEYETENDFESFEDEFEEEYDSENEEYEDEFRRRGISRGFAGQPKRYFSRPQRQFMNSHRPQKFPRFADRPQYSLGLRPAHRRFPIAYPVPYLTGVSNFPYENNGYVTLLQQLLNQVLGLNLPTNGVMDIGTRNAIQSFIGRKDESDNTSNDRQESAEQAQSISEEELYEIPFGNEFEVFEFENDFEGESEYGNRPNPLQYVKRFEGSDVRCNSVLRFTKRSPANILRIVNFQIGRAIRMLRFAAEKLKRGNRSAQTRTVFRKIFRVNPEFVPKWLKQTSTIKDRGDVVATRCKRVADLLEKGGLRYFCTISAKNCPDCPDGADYSTTYACSSWGKHRVVCLNAPFWKAIGNNDNSTVLAVLMHEPFHIYFGQYVTEHGTHPNGKSVGKFGGIYCITQFVFEINGNKNYPSWMKDVCVKTPPGK